MAGLSAAALALAGAHPAFGCAACGCSLSTDGAMGFNTAAGFRLTLQVDFIDQDQLRSGTGPIAAAQVAALNTPAPGQGQEVERSRSPAICAATSCSRTGPEPRAWPIAFEGWPPRRGCLNGSRGLQMTERIECVVVGAGVVGLALARRLAQAGREVVILEAQDRIGTGVSSRNSEVLHAGMYYSAGSLKARLCVAGNARLYQYLQARGVEHRRCGKLIVATGPEQVATLEQILARGQANGVTGLELLSGAQAMALEPGLRCVAALHSPATGIVDTHGLMKALLQDAEEQGAVLVLGSPVLAGEAASDGVLLEVGGPEPMAVLAAQVFNCAGLDAQALALGIRGLRLEAVPRRFLAKGNYYALAGTAPFSRLIYPVPEAAGLGVHLTLDLGGQARFGPDVEWIERENYDVDPARADAFYAAIRRYWPDLPAGSLQPAFAGIRPKLQGPGDPVAQDFLLQGPDRHGVTGLTNLFGIESPGLTACLALAEHVTAITT
jgi:L-2-hydroxyglutarate oxidase LhgO